MNAAEEFERRMTSTSAAEGGQSRFFDRIVAATAASLPVDGAAITMRTSPSHLQLMSATSARSARIEDLQMTLGDGPTPDAYTSYGPVLIADLSSVERGRWPLFEASLTSVDVGSLSALPLQIGAIRLGVLSLYRERPGALVGRELADALDVADAVTTMLLMTGQSPSPDEVNVSWLAGSATSIQINQATGMLIAQLGVSPEEAYVRLRSHAFVVGRTLTDVARDVVKRRLRVNGVSS